MKIGVFGGTFDPPHIGHESIVARLIEKFDKIVIVPSKKTPKKNNSPVATDSDRVKMLSLCDFANSPNCIICDYEIKSNNSPSYTINTIKYIKKKFKTADIYIVMGLDQLNNFNNWHESEKICSIAKIICFNRAIKLNEEISIDYEFINNFDYNISSSDVRNAILNNNRFKTMVNNKIFNYIDKKKLYK